MTDERPPDALRDRIARTIAPVRPLPRPGRRALLFLGLGAALLGGVPFVWGLRENAATLGPWLWLSSALQIGVAVPLFRLVLQESIPGRLAAYQRMVTWGGMGLAITGAVTAITFLVEPSYVPAPWARAYLYVCSTHTFALGVPVLLIAALLLRRGITPRPVLAGALAGLAAGLLADSGWRVYCEVSDPTHVLAAHTSGVIALTALGAVVGALVRRRR